MAWRGSDRCGWVYEIRNTVTGRVYIGSTQDDRRLYKHRERLTKGRHYNRPLQADWDIYGESAFTMTLLEEIRVHYTNDLHLDARLRISEKDHVARAKEEGGVYNIQSFTPNLEVWRRKFAEEENTGPGRVE